MTKYTASTVNGGGRQTTLRRRPVKLLLRKARVELVDSPYLSQAIKTLGLTQDQTLEVFRNFALHDGSVWLTESDFVYEALLAYVNGRIGAFLSVRAELTRRLNESRAVKIARRDDIANR